MFNDVGRCQGENCLCLDFTLRVRGAEAGAKTASWVGNWVGNHSARVAAGK